MGNTPSKLALIRQGMRIGQFLINRLTSVCALAVGEALFRVKKMRLPNDKLLSLSNAHSILVGRMDDRIGDFVLITPFLRELRRNAQQAWITLLVTPTVLELALPCPHVNEIVVLDGVTRGACRTLRRYWKTIKLAKEKLWARRFDLALLPRWGTGGGYRNVFPLYWSGAMWRVGFSERDANFKRQWLTGQDWFLTHPLRDRSIKHEVVRYLDLLHFLGGEIRDERLELWLTEIDEAETEMFLRVHRIDNEPLIAFGIGASDLKRRWGIGGFVNVGKQLVRYYGVRVILVGGSAEWNFAEIIAEELKGAVINASGMLRLRATAALLKRCLLYIGHDTGAMHIAAAVGIPVVEISCHPRTGSPYSWNAPERFGPWGVPCRILQPEYPLPPCREECISYKPHCILQITPKEVLEAVESLLALTT